MYSLTLIIPIAVLFLFGWIVLRLSIRDAKRARQRRIFAENGIDTVGEIIDMYTQGGNGGPLKNINLLVRFYDANGCVYESKGQDVIRAADEYLYRPGENITLTYQKNKPKQIVLHVMNPVLNKK